MNMTREETMNTTFGEFHDMMNCMAITEGTANPKKIQTKKTLLDYLEMA